MKGRDFYTGSKIYWRENRGKWQGVLYYQDKNGKQRQKAIMLTAKKRESQEMFEKIKAELNEQMRVNPDVSKAIPMSSKTVKDRVSDYLNYLEDIVAMGNLEQSTLSNKRNNAELYIYREPIADLPYESVTKNDVIEWITSVMGKGIASSTLNTAIGVLRQTYSWDVEHGIIKHSPMTYVKSPKKPVKPVNYATDVSLKRLNVQIGRKLKDKRQRRQAIGFMMALHMGLRGEEICGLRWKDIHFTSFDYETPNGYKVNLQPAYASIRNVIARNRGKPYAKHPKTNASDRDVPMPDEIEVLLLKYRDYWCKEHGVSMPNPNWYVFGEKEEFYNPRLLSGAFTYLARKYNLIGSDGRYLTLHGLRDTHATVAVQSKAVDIKTLSGIMGHADVATTLRMYTGYGDEKVKREGVTKVSEIINRKSWINPNAHGGSGAKKRRTQH